MFKLKRRLIMVMAGMIGAVVPAAPAVGQIAYGPYLFKNGVSQMCMDVAYGSTANGARIQQWPCYGGPPEQWTMVYETTVGVVHYFQLVNGNSPPGNPKCLDVPWGNPAPGAKLQLWDCLGAARQLWAVQTISTAGNGAVRVKNLQTGLCLDNTDWSGNAGTSLQQWTCNDLPPQHWYGP